MMKTTGQAASAHPKKIMGQSGIQDSRNAAFALAGTNSASVNLGSKKASISGPSKMEGTEGIVM